MTKMSNKEKKFLMQGTFIEKGKYYYCTTTVPTKNG
jgi:hypothetical protein